VNLWVFDNGEIYEATAEGAGTLVKQDNNDLTGSWKHENGRYSVIFKRALNTGDENDLVIEMKKFSSAAFFAWDGFRGESELKCAVSSWYYFVPEGKASMKIWLAPLLAVIITFLLEVLIMKRVQKQGVEIAETNKGSKSD
jgi:hypothetical protein